MSDDTNVQRSAFSAHRFPTGASYYPPHHAPEDWARDVAQMAAAGMTCIRSAELLASWDYIEKVRGQPDWRWLDALFNAAQAHGVQILLGTGSPSPPIWLLDMYPDVQIVDREGRPFPTGTVWGWACRNHPGYRAEAERYLRLLLERYADHPALWAWQIDNEPGFPFITRRGEEHPRLYDYNEHTARAFCAWLEARYGTLDALNIAWRWDCTHHQYASWNQLQPPRSLPQEWGVVTAWLDWRQFLEENLGAFVRWQHQIIRSVDERHPTMTNIFALSGREVEMGLDPWRVAAQADAIGYDLYPGIGRRFLKQPEYMSMFLDFGRSTALHAGRAFWLPELESGPIAGWALGPDHTTRPNDLVRYNLEALGHGAKAILYQGYREWPCIPIHWGALADFHGRPTPRYQAASQVNRMLGDHGALFRDAQPPRAQAAIFADTRNTTLLHGMGAQDLLGRCLRGAYATLWRAGYPVEFVDGGALIGDQGRTTKDQGELSSLVLRPSSLAALPYKVILLPAALLVDEAIGAALRRFVERGGTLIAFAKCAWVDGRGWSWADQPGAGLAELFGADADEVERDDAVSLRGVGGQESGVGSLIADPRHLIPGYWHRQPLLPRPGAEVLARFEDGAAALVRNSFGRGQTFFVGTHLDAAALDSQEAAGLLLALAEAAGLERPLEVAAEGVPVDGHLLTDGERRVVLLTNNGPQAARARVRVAGFRARRVENLLGDGQAALEEAEGSADVLVTLGAWQGMALLIE